MRESEYKERLKNKAKVAEVPNILVAVKRANLLQNRTDDSSIVPQQADCSFKKSRFIWTSLVTATVVLILILGTFSIFGFNGFDTSVYATVNLSISESASYSVELNQESKVILITCDVGDGSTVLQNISFKKKSFPSVLDNLLIAFIDHWDLTEEQLIDNYIIFEAHSHDSNKVISLHSVWKSSLETAKQHCRDKHGQDGEHKEEHNAEHK